ncbi:TPA: serine protease [Candidatus Marinimicrobia bacterium]|nr:MAG: membrane-bound serine protease [Marinimicrobia bacterium 46_43]HAE86645.1 serine protease [Candidatus Neomarinimicrobiota bacterium]HBY19100.1 serine protease [Candidatus Neomarinimicrobiota bacterium]
MKRITIFFACLCLPFLLHGEVIYNVRLDGIINPASSRYIENSLERAVQDSAICFILEMDTPGGLMTAMKDIVKTEFNSPIPFIVYISPSGAQAASAGVFITLASHYAAMAPGTNIGAAHPVPAGGGGGIFGGQGQDSLNIMGEKTENDAVSYIRSLAEKTGRNANWAEDAVRKSVSITANEAVALNVVDTIAPDLTSLLNILGGKTFQIGDKTVTLPENLPDLQVTHHEMSWTDRLLDVFSNPNIAYIFLMLGFYGLFFEITHPGSVFPGVLGVLFLLIAFFSFQMLPVNYAGIALILFGIILLILEVNIVSFGLLTIGGLAAMLIGSTMLIDSPDPLIQISKGIIYPVVILTALFIIVVVRLVVKAMKNRPMTGFEGLTGLKGTAETEITPLGGTVFVNGEIWKAVSDETIPKGTSIEVIDVNHMILKVKKSKGGL